MHKNGEEEGPGRVEKVETSIRIDLSKILEILDIR